MKAQFNKKEFSKRLKQQRVIERRIGMRDAAKEMGVSISTISRCENEKVPDVCTYYLMCIWLDAELSEFINLVKNGTGRNKKA